MLTFTLAPYSQNTRISSPDVETMICALSACALVAPVYEKIVSTPESVSFTKTAETAKDCDWNTASAVESPFSVKYSVDPSKVRDPTVPGGTAKSDAAEPGAPKSGKS